MKKIFIIILIFVLNIFSLKFSYSQERKSAERINFLIENPPKLTEATFWCLNDEGEWIDYKNNNINNEYKNFKELFFNKFKFNNNIYYCLIIKKCLRQRWYSWSDLEYYNYLDFYIYKSFDYHSFVNSINKNNQGIHLLKTIAYGNYRNIISNFSDKFIRFEITKKLKEYIESCIEKKEFEEKYVKSSKKNKVNPYKDWQNLPKSVKKNYKNFNNYLEIINKNNDYKIHKQNYVFPINYQILNSNKIIRFLLPYDFERSYDEFKEEFLKNYFEVSLNDLKKIFID